MASDSSDAAVVVVAVGDEDEGAADGAGLLQGEHLVSAGLVEGVEEGGAAAGTQLADALVEEVDVVGEVLREIGLDVEAFDEGAVVEVKDLEEELDGGVLLELEALADGAAGVEHDADAQGEIGLLGEAEDGEWRTAVVEEAEVLTLEAGDELALLVGDGEDEIDFVDLDADGLGGLVLIGRGRRAGLLVRGLVGGLCCAARLRAAGAAAGWDATDVLRGGCGWGTSVGAVEASRLRRGRVGERRCTGLRAERRGCDDQREQEKGA